MTHRGPHVPDVGEGWVGALGLAVENGLTVQHDLQPALANRGQGYAQGTAELCEKLGRYPSGLGQVASSYAVGYLQVVLILCHDNPSFVRAVSFAGTPLAPGSAADIIGLTPSWVKAEEGAY